MTLNSSDYFTIIHKSISVQIGDNQLGTKHIFCTSHLHLSALST